VPNVFPFVEEGRLWWDNSFWCVLRGKFDVGGLFFVVFFFLSFGLQITTGLYVLGFPTRTFFQEEFQSSRRVRGRRRRRRRRRGDGEKL
jgi:hypothetical protein